MSEARVLSILNKQITLSEYLRLYVNYEDEKKFLANFVNVPLSKKYTLGYLHKFLEQTSAQ